MIKSIFVLVAALLLLSTPSNADRGREHERIRRAVQAGELLPLRVILERAEATMSGQFIEAELEREHGRLVYEIKLLTEDGRVVELYYDARTGDLLKSEE